MERIGIIDLGSNSVRLVIIDIDERGAHHQIENLKETVRLVGSTDERGLLAPEAMTYAASTIRLFSNFCRSRRVDHIMAVATAAVRRAGNRRQLIERIHKETGIEFRVLSGEEEAHLGYVGMVNSVSEPNGLMADLGGGSLKLVSFTNRLEEHVTSFSFGAVTLSNAYETSTQPSPASLREMRDFLESSYQTVPWLKGTDPVIGLGGTFRSLARIVRKRKQYVPDSSDAMELRPAEVSEVCEMLSQSSVADRLQLPGLEKERADIIIAGVMAIDTLLEVSKRPSLVVSTSSIRDGLLYEYLNRFTQDPIVLSVLTHHIDNLIYYYRLEENHLRRVSNLAVTLFDQLTPIHQMGSFERRLLLVASLLHEIGVVISVEGRDKHTLYMLLNAPLHGLNHRERVLIAFTAASHDDLYLTGLDGYVDSGPLESGDIEIIKGLSSLLQITHSLDRSQTGIVTQVKSAIADEKCLIHVVTKSPAELEINDARRKATFFDRLFGYKTEITSD